MKTDMICGFSYYDCPNDGLGPFKSIFPRAKRIVKFSDMELIDAVILWGGADISPSLYNEEAIMHSGPDFPSHRDIYEWEIMKVAKKKGLPIIGVCRGAQIMCAFAGGSLIQDVGGHVNGSHSVTTFDNLEFTVNSFHHQMMYPFDVEYKLLAWSKTKRSIVYKPVNKKNSKMLAMEKEEPEVVYFPTINGFGIQSHPEWEPKDNPFVVWVKEQIINLCLKKEVNAENICR